MLLTVEETARMLNMKRGGVYYLLAFCKLDGVKIRSNWRVFSESVEEYRVKRECSCRNGKNTFLYNGFSGGNESVQDFRQDSLPDDERRTSVLEGRGRTVELPPGRHSVIHGHTLKRKKPPVQLFFDFY